METVAARSFGERQRDPRIASRAPILTAMAEPYSSDTLASYVVLVIVHFLKDLLPFIDHLNALGMTQDHAFLVPVFYSCRRYVQQTLEREGWQVLAASDYERFEQTVRLALIKALGQAEQTGRKLLIVEDGGYAVPLISREFADRLHLVAGAVEQTANGCWRDRDAVAGYQTTYRRKIPFPIVTVGECQLKKSIESPLVADAILQNIEHLLRGDHAGLRGKRVLILGYGDVGACVAEAAQKRGARVGVFDRDPTKLAVARDRGFEIPGLSGPRLVPDVCSFVGHYRLIIGTSGHCSVGADLLAWLGDHTYLVSGSSKRVEIDVKALEARAVASECVDGVGTRYRLPSLDGQTRTITLLADGFPVNFWNEAESIPSQYIELVWALILDELARIARGDNRQTGLCAPDPQAAEKVALLYLSHTS
jgi:S-adenosylhomocysteine hydrolase